ncbi:VENN motif pre-toxin domain-containing protein [Erwinia sp. 9145]|uniref:VENN motif pre-toxin domain-containing protein n=1 Tax=Erwinia sp. 9145 TaxID=1500895 RepID=UPI00068C315A|nr:VENN motif pre-toxin domain-containing protein [Erwinia sp. 9145]
MGEIGVQTGDIARTQGRIIATKAANEKMSGTTQSDRNKALTDLKAKDPTKQYSDEDVSKQVYNNFYNQAFTESGFGTGGKVQQAIQAATAAVQGLAGGDLAKAIAGGPAPYLAEQLHKMTEGNPEANLMAHAVVGAVVAQASGNSALAGAAGAATASATTAVIAKTLYGTDDYSKLDGTQKQTISALSTLASGLAGGLAGDSTASAIAGAQAGKNTSENNDMFTLPKGLTDYGQSASTLGTSMTGTGATAEEISAALSKNAKGDLPDGANITKAIVDGYKDGVLIGGAAYLGPAASIGKAVTGGVIAEIANGTYQWFDLNQPGNENKTWDYKSSGSAFVMGMLAPGRGIGQNVGIAAGGAVFTDGADVGAVGAATAGAWAGGMFGEYAPGIVNSVPGKELPGFIYDIRGAFASEAATDAGKSIIKKQEGDK